MRTPGLFGIALTALAACSQPAEPDQQQGTAESSAPKSFAELKGDPAAGKAAFAQCRMCHAVEAGRASIGPTLHGIIGRQAGAVPGYAYSTAMKDSGITWTDEELYRFLAAPMQVVPGTRMAYAGLRDPQKRADLIAYLASNQ